MCGSVSKQMLEVETGAVVSGNFYSFKGHQVKILNSLCFTQLE